MVAQIKLMDSVAAWTPASRNTYVRTSVSQREGEHWCCLQVCAELWTRGLQMRAFMLLISMGKRLSIHAAYKYGQEA